MSDRLERSPGAAGFNWAISRVWTGTAFYGTDRSCTYQLSTAVALPPA